MNSKNALVATLLVLCGPATAFVVPHRAFAVVQQQHRPGGIVGVGSLSSSSLDDEVEAMVQEELEKTKKMSNLRNEKGVEYAPWMNISPEDEAKIRAQMRNKAEARRQRRLQEQTVKGNLLLDSQGQELYGGGLQYKIVDGESVELSWSTSSEKSTKGFAVKRRAAKTDEFTTLASYETYGPLQSQGAEGGVYRYLDPDIGEGSYVYRVTECQADGSENDLSQCLVDIQSVEEQRGTVIAAAALGVVAIAAICAGFLLDPVQY